MYKRILLKVSGEALSSETETLCSETIASTAALIKEIHDMGTEVAVVCGGGNIIRGRSAKISDRNKADHMGMLATAINALALSDALLSVGVPAAVLSGIAMPRICDEYTSRDANRLLDEKTVVIFACGTGCPFFSTDTGASLRAAEIHADAMLLAKNVDAVYTDDPAVNPAAEKLRRISYDKVLEMGLHATDLTAITMCKEQNIPIKVFALEALPEAIAGNSTGTVIDHTPGLETY